MHSAFTVVQEILELSCNSQTEVHKSTMSKWSPYKDAGTRNSAITDKPHDAFRGQSRSSNMVPFNMLRMVSCYCAIVTLSIRCTVFFRNSTSKLVTLKTGLRVCKGHWNITIRYRAYDFLLMFYYNYGSNSCRFWDIQYRKIPQPWNPSQEPIKVIESGTIR